MEQKSPYHCTACRCEIYEGWDLIEVREGVLGLKGFIPLEEPLLFCSAKCLVEHFEDSSDSACWPQVGDVPQPGTIIKPGHPVLTVFADSAEIANVEENLQHRAAEIKRIFSTTKETQCR